MVKSLGLDLLSLGLRLEAIGRGLIHDLALESSMLFGTPLLAVAEDEGIRTGLHFGTLAVIDFLSDGHDLSPWVI